MSSERPEMERSPDVLDRASALTDRLTEAYVDAARRKARPEQVQNPDGSWPQTECDCGEEIGPARLALGKIRCLDCQAELEARQKRGLA
jgi:RNA polymerase-binding transcription factor DksA